LIYFFLIDFFNLFILFNNFYHYTNNYINEDFQDQVIKQICITYNEFALYQMGLKNYKEALRFIDEALRFKNDDYILHLNRFIFIFL